MPEPSPVVRALSARLRLPRSVAAQVDWASGTLRVNRGAAEWQAFFKNPMGDPALLSTLMHEAHHVLQISTLTYLYKFALQMHAVIAHLVDRHYDDLASLPDSLGEQEEVARNLVWDLSWRDDHGLSPKDIVESLTYFSQHNGSPPRPTADYLGLLDEADVDEMYKRGFRVFSEHAGHAPGATQFYPILSHLALCGWEPRTLFVKLAQAVASGRVSEQTSLSEWYSLCGELEPSFPGFAWQFSRTLPEMSFRFTFTDTQKRLAADEESLVRFWPYLFSPQSQIQGLFTEAMDKTPTILNPIADKENEGFSAWLLDLRGIQDFGPFTWEQRKHWVQYLAAVSRKYIEDLGPPPPGAVRQVVP